VECSNCGLLFIDTPPDDLTPHYFSENGHEMSKTRSSLFTGLREHLLYRDLKPLIKNISLNQTILDLGCGDGAMVRVLSKLGYTCTGADVHDGTCFSSISDRYLQLPDFNHHSLQMSLDAVKPSAIIMRHVLEHLPNPLEVIKTLKTSGVKLILIVVPNVNSRMCSFFGPNWFYWDPPRHLSFFSPQTLRDCVERGGYDQVITQTYGLDEIAVSIYRMMQLNPSLKRFIPLPTGIFHARSLLSSGLSVVSYPFLNSVIRALFVKRE